MKNLLKFLFTAAFLLLLTVNSSAFENDDLKNIYSDAYSEFYSSSGADELKKQLPKQTKEYLDTLGMDDIDPDLIMNVSIGSVFSLVFNLIKSGLSSPVKAMLAACASAIISAVASAFFAKGDGANSVSGLVCGCFAVISVFSGCTNVLEAALSAMKLCSGFEKALIPILAAIITASGNPSLALTYSSASFVAAQAVEAVSTGLCTPAVTLCAALGITGSLIPSLDLSAASSFIRRVLITAASTASLLFTGFLAVKGILANSADSMITRGVKLAANTFVPLVGGAVGEAYSVVIGSISVLRHTVGIYAIIAFSAMCLPVVFELMLWSLSMRFAEAFAKLMGSGQCASIIGSLAFMFTMLNVLLLLCLAVFIISTALTVMIK